MDRSTTSIDDSAINAKYDYILQSSRVLTIPLIRCDQPFNRVIKEEIIEETDRNNDEKLLQIGY
ncbi:uncharacterized protein LOC111030470 [Myzus persicae]|uniref:uncharacterized protein LOC111030470 n=1 Tax=Myzus persicae TaxID=13164 RepID=UPI000B9343B0|nr:uncharacterized protein LOC111030470 [Myzus persicae]